MAGSTTYNDGEYSGRDLPAKAGQYVPLPTTVADNADVTAISDRVDVTEADIATNDGRITFLESGLDGLGDYADDAAAAAGSVAVGELYRTGSIIKVRIT